MNSVVDSRDSCRVENADGHRLASAHRSQGVAVCGVYCSFRKEVLCEGATRSRSSRETEH